MKHASAAPGKYRHLAQQALFASSNWAAALIVTYAVLLLVFTAGFFSDGIVYVLSLLYPVPEAVTAVLLLARFLLLSPLFVGLLYYYTDLFRAANGDGPAHVPPSVIFSAYVSLSSVIRAWIQILYTLFLCALIPASFVPLYFAGRRLLSAEAPLLSVLMLLIGVLVFLSVLYLNARLTPALFLSAHRPELSFGDAVCRTWCLSQKAAVTGLLLQLGLMAAAVLSLFLTAGIVFFVYVLPIAVFTYIGYCHDLSRRSDLI
ncbi:MAG: hypothetical protein E7604_02210 [Ruminococcaceae bacterium]|nr:hypothetical protein [Oscillospiraceae bacterium]